MYYVYILKCGDGSLYTVCTNDLKDRIQRHSHREVETTAKKLPVPVIIITYTAFLDKYKAFEFEKYMKSGSGRAFLNKHLL